MTATVRRAAVRGSRVPAPEVPSAEVRSAEVRSAEARLKTWFAGRGWTPAAFQRTVWRHGLAGRSGLLVTPTGSGKTLAAVGATLIRGLAERACAAPVGVQAKPAGRAAAGRAPPASQTATSQMAASQTATSQRAAKEPPQPTDQSPVPPPPLPRLRLLWITPLRALASDTVLALRRPIDELGLPWTVALRSGDGSARDRRLIRQGRVEVLVTTPESLALLLSYPDLPVHWRGLATVVVDEWHELLGNKRGVLLQLGLARLRALSPGLVTWGLSATIGNLDEAREVLLPDDPLAPVVRASKPRPLTMTSVLPRPGERFPWAGHLGLSQLSRVVALLGKVRTTILFTNTRAQAELWHQALASVWTDEPSTLALHHGSLDAGLRAATEEGLREGRVRCVVATSSLDLGVDFPAVDQVLQVGSPKGMARLLQRAGRARHRPGESGQIRCVPTHVLELAEYAAVRKALAAGRIEPRRPPRLSLDVLAQHCVTLALGGGFEAGALFDEVRRTHAFAQLSETQWQAVLQFIVQGGRALASYPEYHKVVREPSGRYTVSDRRVALRHRLSIGTITSDGMVQVRFARGAVLGAVEESFIGRLRPRDRFQFAGRTLELMAVQDMVAYVRRSKAGTGVVPRWQGGRLPLSSELGAAVEAVLAGPRDSPELRVLAPLLDLQARLSALPSPQTLVAEWQRSRDGWQLSLYPFAGRTVHEGLAALVALRWGRRQPNTFGYAVNDYGLALTAQVEAELDETLLATLLAPERLLEDLKESLNLTEMARRQFRDIARVAGLLTPRAPGRAAPNLRQLQASSGLLFDVLKCHDPDHLLLAQAEQEVFEAQLEVQALQATLARCQTRRIVLTRPPTLTPLSFPLWSEALRGQLSTESWSERVRRAAGLLQERHG